MSFSSQEMRLKREWRGVYFEPIIAVHDVEETFYYRIFFKKKKAKGPRFLPWTILLG
jgi:hypothetical protein